MKKSLDNLGFQQIVVGIAVLVFAVKLVAFLITNSVTILTDTLESTANIAAGLIGLYSLKIAARPRDANHPYGHGKAEFLSAAVEGFLISVAGIVIIYESIHKLIDPGSIQQLDYGMLLIGITALINFLTGFYSIRKGRRNRSPALVAAGKHLQSDAYTSGGVIIGLILIMLTGYQWIDSLVAILFAGVIIFTGYGIIRNSIAGMMDEADTDLLVRFVDFLNTSKRNAWIDLHNLRVIKYGGQLHVDSHLTLPWYYDLREAHDELEALAAMIREEFGAAIEFFVHTDPCLYSQCNICEKDNCPVRQQDFENRIEWTMENLLSDQKHILKLPSKTR